MSFNGESRSHIKYTAKRQIDPGQGLIKPCLVLTSAVAPDGSKTDRLTKWAFQNKSHHMRLCDNVFYCSEGLHIVYFHVVGIIWRVNQSTKHALGICIPRIETLVCCCFYRKQSLGNVADSVAVHVYICHNI